MAKRKIELVEFPVEPEFKLDMGNVKNNILNDLKKDINNIEDTSLDIHNGLEKLLNPVKSSLTNDNKIENNEENVVKIKKVSFIDRLFKILG